MHRVASLANAAGAGTVSGSFAAAGTKFLRAPIAPDLVNIAIRVYTMCGDWRSELPAPAKIATMCGPRDQRRKATGDTRNDGENPIRGRRMPIFSGVAGPPANKCRADLDRAIIRLTTSVVFRDTAENRGLDM